MTQKLWAAALQFQPGRPLLNWWASY